MARIPSLESQRPIITGPNRTPNNRLSTMSVPPSTAHSDASAGSLPSGDPRLEDINHFSLGLQRLENKPLQKQRFVPTPEKSDNLSKLALGAKLERALDRRMTSQDAVMRKPVLNEKPESQTQAPTVAR